MPASLQTFLALALAGLALAYLLWSWLRPRKRGGCGGCAAGGGGRAGLPPGRPPGGG